MILKCYAIAEKAHQGQFRRDGTTPYITHPKAVADKFNNAVTMCVAVLHDVLEDTSYTIDQLRQEGLDQRVVDAVVLLTKNGGSYLDYIKAIACDPTARAVKIEDIKHNLQTSTGSQKDKYELALHILTGKNG